MELHEILNHLGEDRQAYRGAVAPPIVQTSNFCFPTLAQMRSALTDELSNAFYTRGNNPTVEILRRKVAALEGAEDALMFGSGSAAIAAAVMHFLAAGDHVICVQKPYGWTRALLDQMLRRYGVETSFVDAREVSAIEAAARANTKMIVLESPNSMTFEQQDLAAVAELARAKGWVSICDNSWASPLLQSPLALGIDLVTHSATKYLNGHSDVVAGALCGSADHIRQIFRGPFMTLGGILAPHDAWLLLRGLRTLDVRLERIQRSTAAVIAFLATHPKVQQLYYPGHGVHGQAELARHQLRGGSGLLSFRLAATDLAAVDRFCDALQCFLMACSWGGYESLIFPVGCVMTAENYREPTHSLPFDLVRLSIGLEPADALIDDLRQALEQL
ncbi:MAG: PLP-dependent transferase [Xanthomonadales bacterium]|nr:PLP-dependent transferase [Xanthomonadales bacterium]